MLFFQHSENVFRCVSDGLLAPAPDKKLNGVCDI